MHRHSHSPEQHQQLRYRLGPYNRPAVSSSAFQFEKKEKKKKGEKKGERNPSLVTLQASLFGTFPPNSAVTCYATEGALSAFARLSTEISPKNPTLSAPSIKFKNSLSAVAGTVTSGTLDTLKKKRKEKEVSF